MIYENCIANNFVLDFVISYSNSARIGDCFLFRTIFIGEVNLFETL